MTTKALIRLIAVSLAVLFFYAAVSKLDQYAIFRVQLQKYPLALPLVKQQAWLVPVIEMVIASFLLFPRLQVKGLFSALFVLSVYTIYLTCIPGDRFSSPCRCGEPWPSFSLRSNIIFNLFCVLTTGIGVVLCGKVMQPLPFSYPEVGSSRSEVESLTPEVESRKSEV
jgi:uncharacterized membrane protein YphA (DoxX/SURF4 family)